MKCKYCKEKMNFSDLIFFGQRICNYCGIAKGVIQDIQRQEMLMKKIERGDYDTETNKKVEERYKYFENLKSS